MERMADDLLSLAEGRETLLALTALRLGGLALVLVLPLARTVPLGIRLLAAVLLVLTAPAVLLSSSGAMIPPPLEFSVAGGEALLGASLGLIALVVLGTARAAARFIIDQVGDGRSLLARSSGESSDLLAPFATAFALFVLGASGAFRALVTLVASSFVWAPPGATEVDSIVLLARELVSRTFPDLAAGAIALALPIWAGLFVVTALQGVISRAVPQAEILVSSVPVRVAVTIAIAGAGLPWATSTLGEFMRRVIANGDELVRGLVRA